MVASPLLGCRAFEHIRMHVNGEPRDLFCDEMTGIKDMPVNERATELYRSLLLAANPHADPASLPRICGTVVVFDEQVWF